MVVDVVRQLFRRDEGRSYGPTPIREKIAPALD